MRFFQNSENDTDLSYHVLLALSTFGKECGQKRPTDRRLQGVQTGSRSKLAPTLPRAPLISSRRLRVLLHPMMALTSNPSPRMMNLCQFVKILEKIGRVRSEICLICGILSTIIYFTKIIIYCIAALRGSERFSMSRSRVSF